MHGLCSVFNRLPIRGGAAAPAARRPSCPCPLTPPPPHPALPQFYATWCQGCKALFPHMAELAAQRPDIKFLLVEGEENKVRFSSPCPPPHSTQKCRCLADLLCLSTCAVRGHSPCLLHGSLPAIARL